MFNGIAIAKLLLAKKRVQFGCWESVYGGGNRTENESLGAEGVTLFQGYSK